LARPYCVIDTPLVLGGGGVFPHGIRQVPGGYHKKRGLKNKEARHRRFERVSFSKICGLLVEGKIVGM